MKNIKNTLILIAVILNGIFLFMATNTYWLHIEEEKVRKITEVIEEDIEYATWHQLHFHLGFDDGDRRGRAWHHHVVLNTGLMDTRKEMIAVIIHELGHILVNAMNSDEPITDEFLEFGQLSYSHDNPILEFFRISWDWEVQKKMDSVYWDFASGYAQYSAHEDFAESVVYYTLHKEFFYARALESERLMMKYKFIDRLFNWRYYLKWDVSMRDIWYIYDISLLYN